MHHRKSIVWFLSAALLMGSVVGCATLDLPDKLDMTGPSEKVQTPVRMTALWTDTVLVEAGVVGFGGRIMFYGQGDEDPIRVAGELTVFAYDDTEHVHAESVPARKYVFRAEELAGHYSESKLGHSYSFWVPWDRVGGPQRQVSLIARFKSAKGGVVMSEMTRHLLPGSQPRALPLVQSQQSPTQNVASGVAQASHQSNVPTDRPIVSHSSDGMQTTTITLSDALGAAAPSGGPNQLATTAGTQTQGPAVSVPAVSVPAVATAQGATDASSPELSEIRALVREAVQDALAADQEEQPVDRFGRRRYRARIAPKLPPTRDPAATPLHPAAPQSVQPGSNPAAPPIGSASATSVALPPTKPPSSWVR
jgi:hypothetical protein